MTKYPKIFFIILAIFCAACMLPAAHADQPRATTGALDQLLVQLPEVDQDALVDLVTTLRSRLIQRKQVLVQITEDSDLDGGDAFITAIMPGGLLYAGYKKVRHEQVRNELARVNAAIEEYSSDILAMQSGASEMAIAHLY